MERAVTGSAPKEQAMMAKEARASKLRTLDAISEERVGRNECYGLENEGLKSLRREEMEGKVKLEVFVFGQRHVYAWHVRHERSICAASIDALHRRLSSRSREFTGV